MSSYKSLILNADFWQLVEALSLADRPKVGELFCGPDNAIDSLLLALNLLDKIGMQFRLEKENGQSFLVQEKKGQGPYKISFSPVEWLSLMAQVELNKEESAPKFQSLVLEEKLGRLELKNDRIDLKSVMKQVESELVYCLSLNDEFKKILKECQTFRLTQQKASFQLKDGKSMDSFIHGIGNLDGKLSVIAEEVHENYLTYIRFEDIREIKPAEGNYYPVFTNRQVEDFISGIRKTMGTERRVVLKLNSSIDFNLYPTFLFFKDTYLTANEKGEYFWATSTELCSGFFEWLLNLPDSVEVYDPPEIGDKLRILRAGLK